MCAANGGAYSLLIEEKIMELRTGRNKTQVGLLLLPGVAMFAIFTIYPIIKLFMMSFLQRFSSRGIYLANIIISPKPAS